MIETPEDIVSTLGAYAHGPNFETRNEFPRILVQILKEQALENILQCSQVIAAAMIVVSQDERLHVRSAFVHEIPTILQQCQEHACPELEVCFTDALLLVLRGYLYEKHPDIRHTSFSAIMSIIDRLATDKKSIVEKICPIAVDMSTRTDYETNIEVNLIAARLMGRIAPILGAEDTQVFILDAFLSMCSSEMEAIRRTCAYVFSSICYGMGPELTEKQMLDHFFTLCNDTFWGVRKACAETIASLSLTCPLACRKEKLSSAVLMLADDESKWVVGATLKALGPFISTFAEPCITSFKFDRGELRLISPTDVDFKTSAPEEILANYEHYLNLFSENEMPQHHCQKRCYENALSVEQIAEKIKQNKTNIFEKVRYERYLRSRIFHKEDKEEDFSNYFYDFTQMFKKPEETPSIIDFNLPLLESNTDDNDSDSENTLEQSFCVEDTEEEDKTDASKVADTTEITETEAEAEAEADLVGNETEFSLLNKSSPTNIQEKKSPRRLSGPSGLRSIIREATIIAKKERNKANPSLMRELAAIIAKEEKKKSNPPLIRQLAEDETPVECKRPQLYRTRLDDDREVVEGKSTDDDLEIELKFSDAVKLNKKNTKKEEEDAFREYNSHAYWHITPEPIETDLVFCEFKLKTKVTEKIIIPYKPPTNYQQSIVPPEVLEAFIKMVSYEEDEDINLNCAYNFPAVALTIGRKNWHLIKSLLQYLCEDIDWKVRKTIASSIDWLAMILGKDITTRDLLPIYVGFFKDLDEVKIEAIKNFANFLKIVHQENHEEILSKIGDCLRVDYTTNWRIKEDLAKQIYNLIKMRSIINKEDTLLYITSLAGIFLEDKISCVRDIASSAMAEIIKISSSKQQEAILKHFLTQEFALSDSWRKKQTYLNICLRLIKCDQPPLELLRSVLHIIKSLSYDSVPNIRLLVAKNLIELIHLDENIYLEDAEIASIVKQLRQDDDRDVRYTLQSLPLGENELEVLSDYIVD